MNYTMCHTSESFAQVIWSPFNQAHGGNAMSLFTLSRLWEALLEKNGKKRGHCPLLATPPPPPKRVKRGHLLSDYRQKCVNGTRDILMLKRRKMTILAIIMF